MRKNGFVVMWQLMKLVTPLAHIMSFTIIMGTLGFLSAIFIMVLGAMGLAELLNFHVHLNLSQILTALIVLAVARGILRYLEQMSGHYIAFKLLALLRDKVFGALRRLAFVKLQDKQSGQLLSLVTNDIELLEVFYAHTIAPIAIAFLTSAILLAVFAHISWWFVLVALLAYVTIGIILPIVTTQMAREDGRKYRELVGEMNDFFLDSIRGMKEIQLFGNEQKRLQEIHQRSEKIDQAFLKIKQQEGNVRSFTEIAVSFFNIVILLVGLTLFAYDKIDFVGLLVAVILLMSGYGPVIALSNLSNNLLQTLASGERVLALLAEQPELKDVENGVNITDVQQIKVENVSFAYAQEQILSGVNLHINKGEILGIHGRSGSGKSTLLKLIMRFYDPQQGSIRINDTDLKYINTVNLRDNIAYITQQTYIFNETIYENIFLANRNATKEQVIEAAKKASIHEFIMSLSEGYDTKITEMGNNLSDGEKQRIGIARAFLHNAPIILLDEPTSNLDSLNEAMILQSLLNVKAEKLIILVSHRASTMAICDQVIPIANGRMS
ncbi:thiol reductant ABC exporter subunit CydC [Aggregatibacter actinomycetemcomitans]|uniref:thiol reductant ABC exporter subunit CydC n=1 Tax=Aggregatibacter actinomycetemcomitans TaxID=714 RepID=UPI00022ABAAB|nr:thiol reductant ABC exporter subunit CydC [Aggregatibacter actinomycetemcomitans]ANU81639.1 thiol reductant ABC exporter subunit CydC [Aggregatibacter actinomycetemcomitans]KND84690.1 ABC transporter ATP-binding protein [Aggregatibacter actinomycetemcomitans serotype a str. H5P1]KOE31635.1 ABC transporter ATP-binding protein [Aggregatibacter actinomycetemcomitans D17P-3]KOE68571.1 ABC transporter ATP-binding protein [Aggregatibacter actinomycetemcomitans serotype d str. I63B]KOE70536.1 ABC 